MIQKIFFAANTFAALSLPAHAAETPGVARHDHVIIPQLEAPEPEKISGQCSLLVERIEARDLTLKQANQLLDTARVPADRP